MWNGDPVIGDLIEVVRWTRWGDQFVASGAIDTNGCHQLTSFASNSTHGDFKNLSWLRVSAQPFRQQGPLPGICGIRA